MGGSPFDPDHVVSHLQDRGRPDSISACDRGRADTSTLDVSSVSTADDLLVTMAGCCLEVVARGCMSMSRREHAQSTVTGGLLVVGRKLILNVSQQHHSHLSRVVASQHITDEMHLDGHLDLRQS